MRIDGREIAKEILDNLKQKVDRLKNRNIIPHLVIILVGNDPASLAYARQKKIKGEAIGAKVTIRNYESPARNATQSVAGGRIMNQELIKIIEQLNSENNVHGIIIQRPLPEHIDSQKIDQAINPKKDVDSFNVHSKFKMPLSAAVLHILEHVYNSNMNHDQLFIDWLKSKSVLIIGKGKTGGGPIIEILKKHGVEPFIIDSQTTNAQELTKRADIIISAVGKLHIIQPKDIKKGVILISVGLHKESDEKLHGDYEENEIKDIASFYTPSPGGVGPVNVAMLLKNLITATEQEYFQV